MPRKKRVEDVASMTEETKEIHVKPEPQDEQKLYRDAMTESYRTFDRSALVVEKERLFDTIRTRMGAATWKVQCRYEIVCQLLKEMGIS